MIFELGGTTPGAAGHDQLIHTGPLTLDVDLNVSLVNGFVPSVGQSFVLITSASGIAGSFDTIDLPATPANTAWDLVVTATEVRLDLVAAFAPKITEVRVGSTDWAQAFRDELDPEGQGMLLSTGADQLADIPFINANQLFVQFDQPVQGVAAAALQPSDFELIGSASTGVSYQINAVTFDTATNTAVLTLNDFLTLDKVILHIADGTIFSEQQLALDGEWATENAGLSGDDEAGGAFEYRFDTLPGNVNDDAVTNTTDISVVRALGTQIIGAAPGFNVRANVTGDVLVNTTDISAIRALGTLLLIGVDDPVLP